MYIYIFLSIREKFFKWKSYMQGMNNNSAQATGGTSCELSFVKHGFRRKFKK